MKLLRSVLLTFILAVTFFVGRGYAQQILTDPGSVPVPTISLGTAPNAPNPTPPPVSATTTNFLAASPLSPTSQVLAAATALPSTDYVGVTDGATVSGVVSIGPNLTTHPDVRKVAYYLNGSKSGKVYAAPYLWGGPNGNGTTGFDTKTLADGNYTLGIVYSDSTGDHSVAVSFTINNAGPVQPALLGITSGATVSGTITVGPDLTTFGTIQKAEYFLDGVSTGITTVSPFTWGGASGFDTTALTNATHALNAVITDNAGPHTISVNFNVDNIAPPPPTGDFVGVTNGATVSGIVNIGPNLGVHPDVRKVAYYLNGTKSGKVYAAPYLWGGPNGDGTMGFDTKTLANGNYTLGMIYTDSIGDHSVMVSFIVNNTATVQPAILGLTAGATVSGTITVGPDLTTFGAIQQAQYFVDGVSTGITTVSPFTWGGASGFNTTTLTNATHAFKAVITDNAGTHEFDLNFTVNNAVSSSPLLGITEGATVTGSIFVQPNPALFGTIQQVQYFIEGQNEGVQTVPPFTMGGAKGFDTSPLANFENHPLTAVVTDNTGAHTITVNFTSSNINPNFGVDFTGIQEYATVSGVVNIGPNLTLHPSITKVAYYLNDTQSGKVYSSPFLWGGPSGAGSTGFDTRTLPNGLYKLGMVYTDSTGDHSLGTGGNELDLMFTVSN